MSEPRTEQHHMNMIAPIRGIFRFKRMNRSLLRSVFITCAALIVGVALVATCMFLPAGLDVPTTVFIARGTTVAGAVDSVQSHVPLPTPLITKIAVRLIARIVQRPVQPGWHQLQPGDTQWDVVVAILSGQRRPHMRVTVPEGLNYREVAQLLRRRAEIDSAAFVRWCESDSVVQRHAPGAPSMEGYLMPETYDVLWRDDAAHVGAMMSRHAFRAWTSLDATANRHEILTLASIVQAEAATETEMPRIAGVYANRLRASMRLEADPTVQYALGMKRRVRFNDLTDRNEYNTYVHVGLPPGPITNPGAAAIKAALNPERHDYLFFVARGDGSGLHRFGRNGTEHLANVRLYRQQRDQQR